MKNITLSVDDRTLEAVRVYAAERGTSVNALVRAELERIAASEDRIAQARRRIRELAATSKAEVGPVTWTRDDVHER
jgi:plasmid stability protein